MSVVPVKCWLVGEAWPDGRAFLFLVALVTNSVLIPSGSVRVFNPPLAGRGGWGGTETFAVRRVTVGRE